jgi:hypothetical protein
MADGPANQRAQARGLGAGASLAAILSWRLRDVIGQAGARQA